MRGTTNGYKHHITVQTPSTPHLKNLLHSSLPNWIPSLHSHPWLHITCNHTKHKIKSSPSRISLSHGSTLPNYIFSLISSHLISPSLSNRIGIVAGKEVGGKRMERNKFYNLNWGLMIVCKVGFREFWEGGECLSVRWNEWLDIMVKWTIYKFGGLIWNSSVWSLIAWFKMLVFDA